jgi:hypothetical protein
MNTGSRATHSTWESYELRGQSIGETVIASGWIGIDSQEGLYINREGDLGGLP